MPRSQRFPSEVVQPHPLLLVPAFLGAIGTGALVSIQAARVSLIVASGAALSVEACCRVLIKQSWNRRFWPPHQGELAALVPAVVALLWTGASITMLSWIHEPYATGLRTGIAASAAATVIQLSFWIAAATTKPVASS